MERVLGHREGAEDGDGEAWFGGVDVCEGGCLCLVPEIYLHSLGD